jgi:hypothetical protein
VTLVGRRAAGAHGSAVDGRVAAGLAVSQRLAVSAGIVQPGQADGQRWARSPDAVDLDHSTLFGR